VTQKTTDVCVMSGIFIHFFSYLFSNDMTFSSAILAGANDKMNIVNFSFDPEENTFLSGIGGFFLALAYFGTDQSQVGRYLSGNLYVKVKWDDYERTFKSSMQFFLLLDWCHGVCFFSV
jgi:hypothetical protein